MFPDIFEIFKTMVKEEEIEEGKIDIDNCVPCEISKEDPLAR